MTSESSDCCYRVDEFDFLTWVNPSWKAFASTNGATALADGCIGKNLWDFISDDRTRRLYLRLQNDVRSTGRKVTLPFRCDSPTVRRDMQLTISPDKAGGLHFSSRLIASQTRENVVMLARQAHGSSDWLDMCSLCKSLSLGEGWVSLNAATAIASVGSPTPRIYYAVCPACAKFFS